MPKRSDRAIFAGAFSGNPFDGLSPEEIYKEIQWGNKPKKVVKINAPEPLVLLGHLACLVFSDNSGIEIEENIINLAIGAYSNIIYLFPINSKTITNFNNNWKKDKLIKETHYYSNKGNEECYYYHEHEKPYPRLYRHPKRANYIIAPQNFNGNQRSYAVIKEGIVG